MSVGWKIYVAVRITVISFDVTDVQKAGHIKDSSRFY
jgi:hypothetical protein